MDDEWDDPHGDPIDLDGCGGEMTGDPQLDVTGYRSPVDRNPITYRPHEVDQSWLARDRERRRQRRLAAVEQDKAETRARLEARKEAGRRQRSSPTPAPARPQTTPDHPAQGADHPDREEIVKRSLTELQPGQHGAYFERREVRCWWAPWRKRYIWQQTSAWMNTTPPRSGTEVVTVGDLSELPGRVRTIGKVGPTGAVEW